MRKVASAALVAIALLASAAWWLLGRDGSRVAAPAPAKHDVLQTAAPSAPVEPTDPRAASLSGTDDLEEYLVTLEADAKERGAVLPSDVRRGARAIDALSASIGGDQAYVKKRLFGERMSRLRHYLELAPVRDELDRIAGHIETEPDQVERARWVTRYRAASASLTGIYRLEALERLERIAN